MSAIKTRSDYLNDQCEDMQNFSYFSIDICNKVIKNPNLIV